MRFRCIPERSHPGVTCKDAPDCRAKYLGLPGDSLQAFNVNALHTTHNHIGIAEGEIDAITATQAGIPTVGLPGVSSLREYTPRMFVGYQVVYIFADNDDKGQGSEFAERVAELIPNSRVILMPDGHDVNSYVTTHTPEQFRDLTGVTK
jgi:DNA primase